MRTPRIVFVALLASVLLCSACLQRTVVERPGPAPLESDWAEFSSPVRVGGDANAKALRQPGAGVDGADAWSFERCRITTALPEGYPPPTPPGVLEIKLYPGVRRAEVSGAIWPDLGMNLAFWPLFNHIKEREIAMTSPVEMDYAGVLENGRIANDDWTMSFLYREPRMGRLEQDGVVTVIDREPLAVLSLGQRGDYDMQRANEGYEVLRAWLDADGRFEAAGAPRSLYYNGPEQPARDKWSELQLPIRRRSRPSGG